MATRGRLEARITVPTGGWTGTINDSGAGSAVTWTVAAGTYYLSSADVLGGGTRGLIDALSDALNVAATTDTVTVALSAGESGTGLVTITSTATTDMTWVSTDLRDLLGFTTDLVPGTSWTGTRQAKSLWLPDCPYDAPNALDGLWWGEPESDYRGAENAAGYVYANVGQTKVVLERLAWRSVSRNRCIKYNETTTNQSFERFIRESIWADATWATAGGPLRLYPNAASNYDYGTYMVPDLRQIKLATFSPGYVAGSRIIEMPRLVRVPGSDADSTDITPSILASGADTTDRTSYTTSSVTLTTARVYYLAVLNTKSTSVSTPTASSTGATWVQVATETISTFRRITVFRTAVTSNQTGAITIDFAAATQDTCGYAIVECINADVTGTNGSGATVQSVHQSNASATTATINLAALSSVANVHLAFVAHRTESPINAVVTPDSNFVELIELPDPVVTIGGTLEIQWAKGVASCAPTWTSDLSAQLSIEVRRAA